MKKFATLSLAAVAVLTLSACGGNGASNNLTAIDNEVVLNSEDAPLDNVALENSDLAVNSADNFSVDAANTTVEANSTTLNTAE